MYLIKFGVLVLFFGRRRYLDYFFIMFWTNTRSRNITKTQRLPFLLRTPVFSLPLSPRCHVFAQRRRDKWRTHLADADHCGIPWSLVLLCLPAPPAAAAKPPAPLWSPAAPTSTSTPPAKRAPFYSPKSLNKKSRKQPRSTGLPQSGQVPAHAAFDSARRLPSQVCFFLVTFFSFDFV